MKLTVLLTVVKKMPISTLLVVVMDSFQLVGWNHFDEVCWPWEGINNLGLYLHYWLGVFLGWGEVEC